MKIIFTPTVLILGPFGVVHPIDVVLAVADVI
jgi:hypothetical protein